MCGGYYCFDFDTGVRRKYAISRTYTSWPEKQKGILSLGFELLVGHLLVVNCKKFRQMCVGVSFSSTKNLQGKKKQMYNMKTSQIYPLHN